MKRLAITGALCIVTSLAACGGEGSTVERTKAVSAMTPADGTALCESVDASFNVADFIKMDCYIEGIILSQFDQTLDCETVAQECIANPGPVDAACEPFTPDEIAALPPCAADVTLGELEDCIASMGQVISDIAGQISCASDPTQFEQIDPATPECDTVATKCPALIEDQAFLTGGTPRLGLPL